jgi:hypothetical protein
VFAHLDSIDGLRRWCDWIVEYQRLGGCSGGCPLGALGAQVAETDPDPRAAMARALARWERAIVRGYDAMRDRGVLDGSVDTTSLLSDRRATMAR